MIKSTIVFVILISVFVCSKHQSKHDHAQDSNDIETQFSNTKDLAPFYPECIITGVIYCQGKPKAWLRPFVYSPEWPGRRTLSGGTTKENGSYILSSNGWVKTRLPIYVEVRHQCPIKGKPLTEGCAIPCYLTSIQVDHRNKTHVNLDIYLDDEAANSTTDCE